MLLFLLPYIPRVLHITRMYGRVSVCVCLIECTCARAYARCMLACVCTGYVRIYVYNMRSLSVSYL